jgi:hypothetical protein
MNVFLGRSAGSHFAYFTDDGALVVELYIFGEDAPYDSADMISFRAAAQSATAARLRCANEHAELLKSLDERFATYGEVQGWAEAEGIAFSHTADFMP